MKIEFEKYLNYYYNIISEIPFGPSGMFNSEIFIVYVLYKELNCNLFIESGLDWGISTQKFLSLIKDEYIGVDVNQNCAGSKFKLDNFTFMCGNSIELLPNLVRQKKDRNIFLMIDGPKSSEAISLKNKLLEFENVSVVALHDTYDGLENDFENRIFESRSNDEYFKKYFNKLNDVSGLVNIFNLMNYNNKTYAKTYPNGPGVSIYSKLDIKFIL